MNRPPAPTATAASRPASRPGRSGPRAAPAVDAALFEQDWTLRVVLRRDLTGPPLERETVAEPDLAEARSELWFNAVLRAGHPGTPLAKVAFRTAPLPRSGNHGLRCAGFALRCRSSAGLGPRGLQRFGVEALDHVAERAAARLLERGVLREGEPYLYELEAAPAPEAPPPPPRTAGMIVRTTTAALRYLTMPLAPLLSGARPVGPEGETSASLFPVFFTAAAHEKARRFARKGAAGVPPVETGCMLVGRLLASADPADGGEMFVVVEDALEVHARNERFAVVYTARTWSCVQTALRRREEAGDGTVRLVGQAHGHNFAVKGEPCAACASRRECSSTTVFVSAEDARFMRAVFPTQPWALCWIAGTNARREPVARLFTRRGGTFRPRGYFLVDRFDPPGGVPAA